MEIRAGLHPITARLEDYPSIDSTGNSGSSASVGEGKSQRSDEDLRGV